jgi:SET domain-containing protein
MLFIPAVVRPSPIHGFGLFASCDVGRGTAIWKFNGEIDRIVAEEELSKQSPNEREMIIHFGYFNALTSCHVLSCDDSRYINHSYVPNIGTVSSAFDYEGIDVALRDIRAGEELTMDYTRFDGFSHYKLAADRPQDRLVTFSFNVPRLRG